RDQWQPAQTHCPRFRNHGAAGQSTAAAVRANAKNVSQHEQIRIHAETPGRHQASRNVIPVSNFLHGTLMDMHKRAVPIFAPSLVSLRLISIICAALSVIGFEARSHAAETPLEKGYHEMYNLDFPGAQREFTSWERTHPGEPSAPVAEAAGLLFSEFDRLGILEAQFYVDDANFGASRKLSPD